MKRKIEEVGNEDSVISVPSTRVYAMKLPWTARRVNCSTYFSTLDSGLRDETCPSPGSTCGRENFSTLDSGLRDETFTKADLLAAFVNFSTLDSGLRDETGCVDGEPVSNVNFSTLDSGLRDETGG